MGRGVSRPVGNRGAGHGQAVAVRLDGIRVGGCFGAQQSAGCRVSRAGAKAKPLGQEMCRTLRRRGGGGVCPGTAGLGADGKGEGWSGSSQVPYLNRSCPAVSQSCSLTLLPGSISTSREKKSTPTVGSECSGPGKRPSVKRCKRQDLPTVESPSTISRNW